MTNDERLGCEKKEEQGERLFEKIFEINNRLNFCTKTIAQLMPHSEVTNKFDYCKADSDA